MNKSAIFERRPCLPASPVENPFPLRNYSAELVDGKPQLVECQPVSRSLAADFSVTENSLRPHAPQSSRIASDPVDLERFVDKYVND